MNEWGVGLGSEGRADVQDADAGMKWTKVWSQKEGQPVPGVAGSAPGDDTLGPSGKGGWGHRLRLDSGRPQRRHKRIRTPVLQANRKPLKTFEQRSGLIKTVS